MKRSGLILILIFTLTAVLQAQEPAEDPWKTHMEFSYVKTAGNTDTETASALMRIEGKILMIGDIIGDWREEIVTALPGELRIYSTVMDCDTRRICLVQDRQYRLGVSRSTMGYYYPPQLSIKYKWNPDR